jgi:hypothetical protein
VLLVGAIDFHEFRPAVRWLRTHTRLDEARTVAAALDKAERRQAGWHTAIVAQSRPGECSQRDVDRLSHAMPLTHLVALLGSCCEGESRSGRPWPGVVRVYWHQFVARAASALRSDVAATAWQLQRTATDAERVDHALQSPPPAATGLIAVCTPQAVFFDALASACRVAGYSTAWVTAGAPLPVAGAAAVLWHGQLRAASDLQRLRDVVSRALRAPVVALLGFPRYDDVRRARAAGAAAVLPLPLLLPDLWDTLRNIML